MNKIRKKIIKFTEPNEYKNKKKNNYFQWNGTGTKHGNQNKNYNKSKIHVLVKILYLRYCMCELYRDNNVSFKLRQKKK